MAHRTNFRLQDDVRSFLEDAKEEYRGLNMTQILHIAVRHCKEEGILEKTLRKESDETPPDDVSNTSKDEKEGSKVDNEPTNNDSEDSSGGGVRFSDVSSNEEETEPNENDDTRGQDESNRDNDESSENTSGDKDEREQSAASSIRSRFRS